MSREEEEHEHLQKLIELHRANLQHYEELEAKYGLDCPVYVKNATGGGKIVEARKDGGRGGKFRVIRVVPGFRVRGGSTADKEN